MPEMKGGVVPTNSDGQQLLGDESAALRAKVAAQFRVVEPVDETAFAAQQQSSEQQHAPGPDGVSEIDAWRSGSGGSLPSGDARGQRAAVRRAPGTDPTAGHSTVTAPRSGPTR